MGWFAGLDWGSERHAVCVVDGNGKIAAHFEVTHDLEGLALLRHKLAQLDSAGQIPIAFNAAPVSMPFLRGNRLKGLGITSSKRHPLVPNIPTFEEAGVGNFIVAHWYGVLAPAGTPPATVKKLAAQIQKALQTPDVKERFASLALDIAGNGPDEFARIIANDVNRWREVVTKAGIRIE